MEQRGRKEKRVLNLFRRKGWILYVRRFDRNASPWPRGWSPGFEKMPIGANGGLIIFGTSVPLWQQVGATSYGPCKRINWMPFKNAPPTPVITPG